MGKTDLVPFCNVSFSSKRDMLVYQFIILLQRSGSKKHQKADTTLNRGLCKSTFDSDFYCSQMLNKSFD